MNRPFRIVQMPRCQHRLGTAVIYCSMPGLQSDPVKVMSRVPRSELLIAANQHSISQYSLQSGYSREALVSNGRAERAGPVVIIYQSRVDAWGGVVGAWVIAARVPQSAVSALPPRQPHSAALDCVEVQVNCERVLCRTGRTGSHLTYPSRWEGYLSLCATYGITGALWRLILYAAYRYQ